MNQHRLALAAYLKITSLGQSVGDANITAEVAERKEMEDGEGHYTKKIFKEPLAKYRHLVGKARKYYRDMTFEGIGNQRLLAVAEEGVFSAKMAQWRQKIQDEVNLFIATYEDHLEAERRRKVLAFRATDYPPKHELAGKFGFEVTLTPVADPSQFQANGNLDSETAAKLKAQYEQQLAAAIAGVQDKVLKTLVSLIQETAATLADPDAPLVDSENKKGPVAKLSEYLDRVPALNLTNDLAITKLAQDCRQKLILATKVLKENSFTRSKTSQEASAILQHFKQGYGRSLVA